VIPGFFFFVGPVVGIIKILVAIALFGWWLVRMIGSNDVSSASQQDEAP
jgi:hypothetical protein